MRRQLIVMLLLAGSPAWALDPPPPTLTAVNQPLIGAPLYVVPYAIQRGSPGLIGRPPDYVFASTFITVGNNSAGQACDVQVEWRDRMGALVGVSGPVSIAPEQTRQFSPMNLAWLVPDNGNYNFLPFFYDVLSSAVAEFSGHAKVRSTCTAIRRLRVDAVVAVNGDGPQTRYFPVHVTRLAGNVGD